MLGSTVSVVIGTSCIYLEIKINNKEPGVVTASCNPSTLRGRRIAGLSLWLRS